MKIEVWNLLEEFDKLEKIIRSSMMPDEREIIKGINIVRGVVRELNVNQVDNEFKNSVKLIINKYESSLNSQMKVMNSYVKYGINRCMMIIDSMVTLNCDMRKDYAIKVRCI